MIRINLKPKPPGVDLSNVGGLDLTRMNVKMIILAIAAVYGVDFLFNDYWTKEFAGVDARVRQLSKELRKVRAKYASMQGVEKQVEAFKKQEEYLANRLDVVKKILSNRKNPMNIMLYLAKNTPKDLWLTEMSIKSSTIRLTGQSFTYKSIGDFIENLRSSIFFDKNLRLSSSKTLLQSEYGRRLEEFVIEASVVRYQ